VGSFPVPNYGWGTIGFAFDEKTFYYYDDTLATPAWVQVTSKKTLATVSETCGGNTTHDFTISCPESQICHLELTATSGGSINYTFELFSDSGRTTVVYRATSITASSWSDVIPWEWVGGSTMYGKITNNVADAITNLDIDVKYRL